MKSSAGRFGWVGAACLVVALSWVATSARADVCPIPDGVRVNVRLLDPSPNVVVSSNLKQINSRAQAHGLLKRGSMVLGLTQSEVGTSMNMRFRGQGIGAITCISVDRIDASFGHSKLEVQLPKEYARGSCQYKTVLRHEMEHVRVNREGVRKYAQILKRALEKAVNHFNPRQTASMDSGQDAAKRILQKTVQGVVAAFNKDVNAQHALIDQPGGPYDANGACREWK
jgi:hypothetical protein